MLRQEEGRISMLSFKPFDEEEGFARYRAVLENTQCGECSFSYSGYEMRFISIDTLDDIIAEGLMRSAMNYCATRGMYISAIEPGMLSPAARRLGFSDNNLTVEIPEALSSSECKCGPAAE